jgi:hypothetical protein
MHKIPISWGWWVPIPNSQKKWPQVHPIPAFQKTSHKNNKIFVFQPEHETTRLLDGKRTLLFPLSKIILFLNGLGPEVRTERKSNQQSFKGLKAVLLDLDVLMLDKRPGLNFNLIITCLGGVSIG